MATFIEEIWTAVNLDVVIEQANVAGETGIIVQDQNGQPATGEIAVLEVITPLPDGARKIRIPMEDAARQELVRRLTGGIIVPTHSTISPA